MSAKRSGGYQALVGLLVFLKWLGGLIISFLKLTLGNIGLYYGRRPLRMMTDFVFAMVLTATVVAGVEIHRERTLAQITDELVSSIDDHTSLRRDFGRKGAKTNKLEFLKVGAPEWLRNTGIRAIIEECRLAGLSNVECAVQLATAERESGFNPLAMAWETEACGLFQFKKETGERFGLSTGKCMDPRENTRAQIKHFRWMMKNRVGKKLEGLHGSERLVVMYKEYYCKHHDGPNRKDCSDIAEQTVARGVKFLMRTYRLLVESDKQIEQVPSFNEKVWGVFKRGTSRFTSFIETPFSAIGLGWSSETNTGEWLKEVAETQ